MAIDNQTVKKVAFLSRLRVEDEKIESAKDEFNKILQWIDELNELNTDNVEPLISVNEQTLRLREDEITAGNNKDEILQNAPMEEFDYFAVPKVVE
ncbi:MAG: Asp-tRNA(Asn)/Glu-tRNA(Gln) amidotransferase subunit GatC [Alphaproteobacteria bacterium]|nr:Asp-tRNA(Asn)/Glu-tRNA(Gln) amidotransferase subunit GatC [Alphaproteobacteria bacterium]MBR3661818.1 Asp-tRNA(Asn)/Glu-tRNA(Gln) amidotransferase subunit GatC [Alphaproteobacteria bacterium]